MTLVLYYFQGELGECEESPNGFMMKTKGQATFGNFLSEFVPLMNSNCNYCYRFKVENAKYGYVWKDISDNNAVLPTNKSGSVIFAKILNLDNEKMIKRKSRLQLKPSVMEFSSVQQAPLQSASSTAAVAKNEVVVAEKPKALVPPVKPKESTPKSTQDSHNFFEEESVSAPKVVEKPPSQSNFDNDFIDIDSGGPSVPEKTREDYAKAREERIEERVEEALKFKIELDNMRKKEEEELENHKRNYDSKLEEWSSNNKEKRNVRTLLSTMHTVLWPGNKWKAIGLGDVLDAKQVKLQYRKAMLVIHPDKVSTANSEIRFIAKRLFEAVNEAYQEFLKKENA